MARVAAAVGRIERDMLAAARRDLVDTPPAGARFALREDDPRRAQVRPHPRFFAKLGVPERSVRADFVSLQRKHPDDFADWQAARSHVEAVLGAPDYALPGNQGGNVVLIRREDSDRLVAVRLETRGTDPDYWVRSAYVMTKGQLDRQFEAIRRQGGTPELLAFSRLPETNDQAAPTTPRDVAPADRLKDVARGGRGGKPRFSLRDTTTGAPPFYSALLRGIEDVKLGKAPPAQWQGIVRNLSQKGVKAEEIEWLGLNEWRLRLRSVRFWWSRRRRTSRRRGYRALRPQAGRRRGPARRSDDRS